MRTWMIMLLAGTAASLSAVSCGSSSCEELQTCGGATPGTDGGPGTDTGADAQIVVPAGCDLTVDAKDAPKCVDDSVGVFVDGASGNDANPGTKASPKKTINAGLAAAGSKPRVYVCEGTYAEHVKVTSAVSVYGGFACGSWSYSGTKAKVAPGDAGYALEVNGVASAVVVADVEAIAVAGTSASVSSLGALVSGSAAVTLRRVKLQAAAGLAGPDGAAATQGTLTMVSSGATTLDGNGGSASEGGAAKTCTCSTGGTSKGGKGGDPTGLIIDGAPGETVQASASPPTATGVGGTRSDCEATGTGVGRPGSGAPSATEAATPTLGTVDSAGWHPGDGASGSNGVPGQGGGGGGSYVAGTPTVNGGGGSGACGGCGGGGGGGGKGGGASVALVSFQSTLKLETCALVAADAGAGGTGKPGADGVAGGIHGTAGNGACVGGNGGTGGHGGAGAGGAGGLSVGVLYKGTAPTLDSLTIVTTGGAGTKGAGGKPGVNDGIDGQKADTLAVP